MKKIHFIAIGGAIMHQLAIVLKNAGYTVSGSDDAIYQPAKSNLENNGLLPKIEGWDPNSITVDIDEIILGMHAKGDNPELLKAQSLGIPVYSFPEYIYKVSEQKQRIVIAGSHGKTSTTAMVMHALKHNGLDFDYLVGAHLEGFEHSVRISNAPIIVLEGDEYPASVIEKKPKILFYKPQITVLTGIAWDHINVFPTYEIYLDQFRQYLNQLSDSTTVIYNSTDEALVQLINEGHTTSSKLIGYQYPQYRYNGAGAVITYNYKDYPLQLIGKHNFLNLEAARQVAELMGVNADNFYKSMESFKGAAKRLEKLYEKEGLVVIRDFAHAPSKLKATLDAVKEVYEQQMLIACFELHTFSSLTKEFLNEYKDAMSAADYPIVYISEEALKLKNREMIAHDEIRQAFGREDIHIFSRPEELLKAVRNKNQSSAQVCLLLMSSGTFDQIDWVKMV